MSPYSIVFLGAMATSGIIYLNNEDATKIEEIKTANLVIQKKEDLKEFASLQGISYETSSVIKSEAEVSGDNVMKIIIPSKDAPHGVKMLLSKYQYAINTWYETNKSPSVPNCTQLSTAKLIDIDDCNKATAIDLELYSFENGTVSYKTASAIGDNIKNMKGNFTQEKISADANTNKYQFLDKGQASGRFDDSQFENESKKIRTLKKEVITQISEKPLKASKINNELAKLDKLSALNNAIEIMNVVNADSTISANEVLLITRELQKTVFVCRNSYLKFVPTEVYNNTSSASTYMAQNNLELESKTNILSNFVKGKLSLTQIAEINATLKGTQINSSASIDDNFNLWKGN